MIFAINLLSHALEGGIFQAEQCRHHFRINHRCDLSADALGLFIHSFLSKQGIDPQAIQAIGCASVVPQLNGIVTEMSARYFDCTPLFLQPGIKTGLKLGYKQPQELGADRIARAVAAIKQCPNKNLIIVAVDTITTICAITSDRQLLGGAIFAGPSISTEVLHQYGNRLPTVGLAAPTTLVGQTTTTALQSGLFYSQQFAIKGFCQAITESAFKTASPLIIGTGHDAKLFTDTDCFHIEVPTLAIDGIAQLVARSSSR